MHKAIIVSLIYSKFQTAFPIPPYSALGKLTQLLYMMRLLGIGKSRRETFLNKITVLAGLSDEDVGDVAEKIREEIL